MRIFKAIQVSNLDILHVVFGLHWYQPPTQKRDVLKRIINKSYLPLLNALETVRCGSVACDISASLIIQLADESPAVIDKIVALKKAKKITLVTTAAYHPILPLVPAGFAKNQLELNEQILRRYGLLFAKEKPDGVFPPEMAFDEKLLPVLEKLKSKWVVMDDLPYNTVHKTPTPATWLAERSKIVCLMRSRFWSNEMSFHLPRGDDFANELFNNFGLQFERPVYQAYVVLWTDAETFGEHHPQAIEHFLKPFIRMKKKLPMNLTSPEDILKIYSARSVSIPPGSWSSMAGDVISSPFAYWKNPKEEWHKLWWDLAELALKISAEKTEVAAICDRTLYSCQTWYWTKEKCKDLFLWAVPDFRKILESGTPSQKKTGESLISGLS